MDEREGAVPRQLPTNNEIARAMIVEIGALSIPSLIQECEDLTDDLALIGEAFSVHMIEHDMWVDSVTDILTDQKQSDALLGGIPETNIFNKNSEDSESSCAVYVLADCLKRWADQFSLPGNATLDAAVAAMEARQNEIIFLLWK
jgi:hypothetical protein